MNDTENVTGQSKCCVNQHFAIKISIIQTSFVMLAISVVVTDVNLVKEFRVIHLLDSSSITGVVVFTPTPIGAPAAVC